jgi:polyhydroxybutyrate depolymerase
MLRSLAWPLGAAVVTIAALACDSTSDPGTGPGADGGTTSSGGTSGASSSGASSGTSGNVPKPSYVDVTAETFEIGGSIRQYFLAKPKPYDAQKSYPLVMSFHGNPGTANDMKTGLPFDSVSTNQAVIVYPGSIDPGGWQIYEPTDQNVDMPFIEALVDEVAKKVKIDKSRTFGFGYSGGGFFIAHFACRHGGIFKAISVNAGGGPDEDAMGYAKKPNGCYVCPGGPVATIVTHGAADTEVEVGSGEFTALCYASTNGCDESMSATKPAPCQQYDGCPAGKPVKQCIIPGQGHGPWQGAMKEAWDFFNALP